MTVPVSQERAAAPEEMVRRLGPWFHNLHLPDGTQTAPEHRLGDFPAKKWRQLAPTLPEDLTGWRALDVGCNAGFYSFELARRGARVCGIDVSRRYLRQARWARRRYGLTERVGFRRMPVYHVGRLPGRYELTLFMGVFYHLRYPLLALDLLARKTREILVFQALSMPGDQIRREISDRPLESRDALLDPGWPKMAFIEERFAGDPTNWWIPNLACIEALLRSAGLRVIAHPAREIYVCRPEPERPPLPEVEHRWLERLERPRA